MALARIDGFAAGGAGLHGGYCPKSGYDAALRRVKGWARFGLMRCSKHRHYGGRPQEMGTPSHLTLHRKWRLRDAEGSGKP